MRFSSTAILSWSCTRLDRVKTPVLVESGEQGAWKRDRVYFRGLQHFWVPSEWYVYPRSGHGWDEPGLMLDAYRRHVAWFDYWIHGKPYPDASKLGGYEA